MKTKLFITIILVEVVSLLSLYYLLNQSTLPGRTAVVLIFFQPVVFGLHVFEEFIFPGGYTDWYKKYSPRLVEVMTPSYLVKVNVIPLITSVLVSLGSFDYISAYSFGGIRAWMTFLSILFVNAIFHIRGSLLTKQYSPGVVTCCTLYIPLTVFSFTYLLKTGAVDIFSVLISLGVGLLFQPLLDYIKNKRLNIEK
jgi:hypothetical protein